MGGIWAHFGSLLGSFLRPWGAWGGLGAHFSEKVDPFNVPHDFLDALGRSWGPFGSKRGPLGLILAALGLILGVLGVIFGEFLEKKLISTKQHVFQMFFDDF